MNTYQIFRQSILLFVIFFYSLIAKSVDKKILDSCYAVVKTTTKINDKLNALYTLSYEYGTFDPYKGIEYGFKCVELAKSSKNTKYLVNGYNGIANAYETLMKYDSALFFHQKSYETAKGINHNYLTAITLSNIAICYKNMGEYKKALNHFLIAYGALSKEKIYNPRVHFYITDIYLRLKEFEDAEFHARLGIQKCKEFNQYEIINNLYLSIAKCMMNDNKLDSAKHYLNIGRKGIKENMDKTSLAIAYQYFGEYYLLKRDYQNAYISFSEENKLQEQIGCEIGKCLSLVNMAYSLSHFKKDENKINEMLKNSEILLQGTIFFNDILIDVYYKMSVSFEKIDNSKKALYYHKLYLDLYNKLLNNERVKSIQELKTRFETKEKNNQIILLKHSNEISKLEISNKNATIKSRNIIVSSISIFVVLLFLIFIFYLKTIRIKNELENEKIIHYTQEQERRRLSKDIHDDLGSGLSKIRFLSEQIKNISGDEIKLNEYGSSINDVSTNLIENMKDLIWALNSENTTSQNLVARIREYSTDYLEGFDIELELEFPREIRDFPISKEFHHEIFMITKECLNNIIKHSKTSKVLIQLVFDMEKLKITISDFGIGADLEKINHGNGLRNIRKRVESIHGEVIITSKINNGTTIAFNAPFTPLINTTFM
ncbi:MAG: tetratricopeptide repeat protein [Flavobacteriales bacterium]|nr:tetratricopeptide repeat protein [Flavobacteriales bacterium]